MRFVAVVVLAAGLLLAALFAYPPWLEDSDGECRALEQRVAALGSHDGSGRLTVSPLYGSSSSSPSGAAFARDHYPLLPPEAGCAFAYWMTVAGLKLPAPAATPAAATPTATAAPPPVGAAAAVPSPDKPQRPDAAVHAPSHAVVSIISRDITPNGDPISPGPLFTLPMNAVAIRVDDPAAMAATDRFVLLQGRAVITSCIGQKTPPRAVWCRFAVGLRKGNYAIAFTANNTLVGQFPFTVLGN